MTPRAPPKSRATEVGIDHLAEIMELWLGIHKLMQVLRGVVALVVGTSSARALRLQTKSGS